MAGCGDAPEAATCPGELRQVTQSIYYGAPSETFLGLADEDVASIVRISDSSGAVCTGVLVRGNWVLTGAHCLAMHEPVVTFRDGAEASLQVAVSRRLGHPTFDVALLEIEAEAWWAGARPIAVGFDPNHTVWVGQRVVLAGYGLTESGATEGLRFSVEAITLVDDHKIRVDGLGRSGACDGDSGGPLLARGADGAPIVLGVLSTGSASCVGRDSYVRADLVSDWIVAEAGPESLQPSSGCGSIDEGGTCLYGLALHCAGGVLVPEICPATASCGWSTATKRFACIGSEEDPCKGISGVGACEGSQAMTCHAGRLRMVDCAPCSACVYSPDSGRPECAKR